MSESAGAIVPELQRVPMSYDDYRALPEKPKVEWVDGVAVIGVAAFWKHSYTQAQLTSGLVVGCPSLLITTEIDIWVPRNRVRRPDIAAYDHRPEGDPVSLDHPPVLIVEILSPSTRSEDRIRKLAEYRWAGVEHYWLVDPDVPSVEALRLVEGEWEPNLILDAATPVGVIDLGRHGDVRLDVNDLVDR